MNQHFMEIENPISILWPYRKLKITFIPNSEGTLNSLDFFLLESLKEGYSLEQVSEATLLPLSTIQSEVTTLVKQQLLHFSSGNYHLSEQCNRSIFVRTLADAATKSGDGFIIDCVTSTPEKAALPSAQNDVGTIVATESIIDKNEVLDISSGDEFYRSAFECLSVLPNEQYNYFCKSVMCRVETGSEIGYKEKKLYAIPSAFQENSQTPSEDEFIVAASSVIAYTFKVQKGKTSNEVKVYFDCSTGKYSDLFDDPGGKNGFSRYTIKLDLHSPDLETAAEYAKAHDTKAVTELISEQSIMYYSEIPMFYIRSK